MSRNKNNIRYTPCPICHKQISNNNLNKHIEGHKNHPERYRHEMQHVDHNDLFCKYCHKELKNKNSLAQHECRCRFNENHYNYKNLMNKKEKHYAWNKGLTKETDSRVKKGVETHHKRYLEGKYDYSHNKHSEETKEKIRQIQLKRCSLLGTNLCGKGLRGYYKGYYCQSSWELAYVIFSLENNINFIRNNKGFKYIFEGLERTYFPDFYLPETNTYVEIKGYYDKKTKIKQSQFTGNLIMLTKDKMIPILNYVIEKYGKDFTRLYETDCIIKYKKFESR